MTMEMYGSRRCGACGEQSPHPLARFCQRCGAPLAPPTRATAATPPAMNNAPAAPTPGPAQGSPAAWQPRAQTPYTQQQPAPYAPASMYPVAVGEAPVLLPGATWLALAGGAGAVIASFLPWVTAHTYDGAPTTVSGTAAQAVGGWIPVAHGWISVALGAAVALLALLTMARARDLGRGQGIAELVLACILGWLALHDIADVSNMASSLLGSLMGIGVGAGLWLEVVAAAVIAIAGIWRLRAAR